MQDVCYAEIQLDALVANTLAVRQVLGNDVSLAAVVKANGYGLGALTSADSFLEGGAQMIALARVREALEIRRGLKGGRGKQAALLVMGKTRDEDLEVALRAGLRLTIMDESQARLLSDLATEQSLRAIVHIKVDTGMNRLGLGCDKASAQAVATWAALPNLYIEGVFSHLALVDEASDHLQAQRFLAFIAAAEEAGLHFPIRHLCDSIGFLRYPEYRFDMVRAGAILYGMGPLGRGAEAAPPLRFPVSLRSVLSRVKPLLPGEGVGYDHTYKAGPEGALLGTVPLGYADGYSRRFSNVAQALVRGKRVPVVGLICMDQLNLDLSSVPDAQEGDEVVFLGTHSAASSIASEDPAHIDIIELARWAGTNRNEILASLSRRLERRYLDGDDDSGSIDYLLD